MSGDFAAFSPKTKMKVLEEVVLNTEMWGKSWVACAQASLDTFLFYSWPFFLVYILQENIIFYFNSWLSFWLICYLLQGFIPTTKAVIND